MAFKRLQEQAYDHLRSMVLAGEFEKGIIYSETKTAEMLGISRTPIRDALQKLSHDGLIDIMPSKGFCIHTLTCKDMIEIYQLRCAIEGYCARLISSELDKPEAQKTVERLSELLEKQKNLNKVSPTRQAIQELVELDYQLHLSIVSYPGNDTFTQMYSNNMYRMRIITIDGQEREDRRKSSLAEHDELVAVIKLGCADTVYRSILHHYQNMINSTRMRPLTRSGRFVEA